MIDFGIKKKKTVQLEQLKKCLEKNPLSTLPMITSFQHTPGVQKPPTFHSQIWNQEAFYISMHSLLLITGLKLLSIKRLINSNNKD